MFTDSCLDTRNEIINLDRKKSKKNKSGRKLFKSIKTKRINKKKKIQIEPEICYLESIKFREIFLVKINSFFYSRKKVVSIVLWLSLAQISICLYILIEIIMIVMLAIMTITILIIIIMKIVMTVIIIIIIIIMITMTIIAITIIIIAKIIRFALIIIYPFCKI